MVILNINNWLFKNINLKSQNNCRYTLYTTYVYITTHLSTYIYKEWFNVNNKTPFTIKWIILHKKRYDQVNKYQLSTLEFSLENDYGNFSRRNFGEYLNNDNLSWLWLLHSTKYFLIHVVVLLYYACYKPWSPKMDFDQKPRALYVFMARLWVYGPSDLISPLKILL